MKKVENHIYYYLEHRLPRGGRVLKKRKSLGKKSCPQISEELKKEYIAEFMAEIYKEKWLDNSIR